jgi:hypothetical protein
MSTPTYPGLTVKLTGTDGNAFALIGVVRKSILRAHGSANADEFAKKALACKSYDELLAFLMETVEVV